MNNNKAIQVKYSLNYNHVATTYDIKESFHLGTYRSTNVLYHYLNTITIKLLCSYLATEWFTISQMLQLTWYITEHCLFEATSTWPY